LAEGKIVFCGSSWREEVIAHPVGKMKKAKKKSPCGIPERVRRKCSIRLPGRARNFEKSVALKKKGVKKRSKRRGSVRRPGYSKVGPKKPQNAQQKGSDP